MNKIRRVWDRVCRLLDEISTYKVSGQIRGEIFLYHSGSIVNAQVVNNRDQLDEQSHSITANSANPNFAQPSGQNNLNSHHKRR